MLFCSRSSYSSQKGNVLFIILITVALFAALSYAVSSSFRGGTKTISGEQARIAAGSLLRSMQSIREGYQYLWTQKGCSLDDISFEKAGKGIDSATFTDKDDDGPDKCMVFGPLGAGVPYPENLAQYHSPTAAAETQLGKFLFIFPGFMLSGNKVVNIGTEANDHIVQLNFVHTEICMAINKQLKLPFTSIPVDDDNTIGDTDDAEFAGKTAGCRNVDGVNQAFFVLLEL